MYIILWKLRNLGHFDDGCEMEIVMKCLDPVEEETNRGFLLCNVKLIRRVAY